MEKTNIYIYGSGGHGKVVADIARSVGYENIIFLDDKNGVKFSKDLPKFDLIVAIGDNEIRANLQDKAVKFGFDIVNLVHPKAVISKSVKFGKGVVVMPNAVINSEANVGDGAIINSGAIIEHDCIVGEFSHISPNVALAGGVRVGKFCHIGISSSIIQNINIGDYSVLGAGATLIDDIPSNCVAVGVPARIIKGL